MYSVTDYLWMIADTPRVEAYSGALRALVRPGARVVEVGAGFGFFSVVAARAGASHVDAIDTNPAIHLGPKVAAANGCAERIRFHRGDSTEVTLDEPADVLIADLRGPTPFSARALGVLIDARRRHLRPGGTIIAARDTVMVAPSRMPAPVQRRVVARDQSEVVLDPIHRVTFDTPMAGQIAAGDLLGEGRPWTHLEYATIEALEYGGHAAWTFAETAEVEGLAVWFESDVGAGFRFSAGPLGESRAYGQLFVPFRRSVRVPAGAQFTARLGVRNALSGSVWEWSASITEAGQEREVLAQNSLASLVIDPAALRVAAVDMTGGLV